MRKLVLSAVAVLTVAGCSEASKSEFPFAVECETRAQAQASVQGGAASTAESNGVRTRKIVLLVGPPFVALEVDGRFVTDFEIVRDDDTHLVGRRVSSSSTMELYIERNNGPIHTTTRFSGLNIESRVDFVNCKKISVPKEFQ